MRKERSQEIAIAAAIAAIDVDEAVALPCNSILYFESRRERKNERKNGTGEEE